MRSDDTMACYGAQRVEGRDVTRIAVGSAHVCAIATDDTIQCAGISDVGELGHGHNWRERPTSVATGR
jgi:alpha-tubulin suppressor-like RCC1 family protein